MARFSARPGGDEAGPGWARFVASSVRQRCFSDIPRDHGKKLCFQSTRDGDLDIWVMSSDGRSVTKITDDGPRDPLDDFWCNWSADGKMLAYTSGADGISGTGGKIFTSDANGSNERLFIVGGISDFDPDWEPVGSAS